MGKRPKMLASSIRELIAPVLRTCPPECGIVSITDVQVSDDFSYATVYISALQEAKKALDYLEDRQPELQRLMSRLERQRIPLLRFRIDRIAESGARIDQLLDTL